MRDGNSSGPRKPGEATVPSDPGEPASVHVILDEDRTRIVLSGEVDADLAADLAEATSDAEVAGRPIDIDAAHVTFMDSSGIAFLARLASRVPQPVRVLRAPESVRFLLEVTRIRELLEVVEDDTEPAADAALPHIGPHGRERPEPPDTVA
ncbi:STAS domain-containing protein [Actinotalea sp. M2MS4P-6]|uniref:STAS domain-containing protein n=1 Tax=Actinotalea sp. M2MS4P-6 TaxID=2983762 RepID=UPI0021E41AB0|nr:STAS domain-containing protein [Actinotalea sp. M2MS4P-6]MCV2395336.1 STAS domain-containing protein [Actinotalea sp. M2MS4P-6]